MKITVKDEYPQLYALYTESEDPDVIRQAIEMMRSLGALTAHDDPMLKRIVDSWRLNNIVGVLYRFHDVFLIIDDEYQALLYPHPWHGKPFFSWVNTRGFREGGASTLKGILEVINTRWGMTAPPVK
tara:strand:+ start:2640 stop:3020 length:381 start_codon:yes stop_codon:yes gene_type:complete